MLTVNGANACDNEDVIWAHASQKTVIYNYSSLHARNVAQLFVNCITTTVNAARFSRCRCYKMHLCNLLKAVLWGTIQSDMGHKIQDKSTTTKLNIWDLFLQWNRCFLLLLWCTYDTSVIDKIEKNVGRGLGFFRQSLTGFLDVGDAFKNED